MNSYNREPLQVKPEREIPQEIMFNLKQATKEKDPLKPNRYWFTYPENWVNTPNKECIIGIRDMFIVRNDRYLHLDWEASVFSKLDPETPILTHKFFVETYMDSKDGLTKLMRYTYQFTSQQIAQLKAEYDEKIRMNKAELDKLKSGEVTSEIQQLINALEEKIRIDDIVLKAVKALKPFRFKLRYDNKYTKITLYNDINTDEQNQYGVSLNKVSFGNSDFDKLIIKPYIRNVQHEATYYDKANTEYNMYLGWDRKHLYLTSSIASLTYDNYLGHTDRTYEPIKYYRLHSNDNKFWVDMNSTRNHSVYSILPSDNLDEFIIEAIVCFDSSAII